MGSGLREATASLFSIPVGMRVKFLRSLFQGEKYGAIADHKVGNESYVKSY